MIKPTFWRAFALTATLILTGCSHSQPEQEGRPQAWLQPGTRITLPAPGISPAVNSQQLLSGSFNGKTQSLLVMLNADDQKITLAGLSSVLSIYGEDQPTDQRQDRPCSGGPVG